jgi:hypothetical protein
MTCETYRHAFGEGSDSAETRAHFRSCEACLAWTLENDPDALFRSIGGAELVPAGGIDEFVGGVMREIRVRETERTLRGPRRIPAAYRWAVAAMFALAVVGGSMVHLSSRAPERNAAAVAAVPQAAPLFSPSAPVVESYQAAGATIIEMPASSESEIRLVMIFDETLPMDL